MRAILGSLLLVGLTPLSGCKDTPKLAPVTGRVVVEGRPTGNDTVAFVPVGGLGKERSLALLDREGKFTLRTHPHGEGVMPGKYKVLVQLEPGSKLFEHYGHADTTPLEVEVPDAGLKDYENKLVPKK